jgi:hypothetical protein
MNDTEREGAENEHRAIGPEGREDATGPRGTETILRERSIEALWVPDIETIEPALSETWPATPVAIAARAAHDDDREDHDGADGEEPLPLVHPRATVAGARFVRSRTRAYARTLPFLSPVTRHDTPAPSPAHVAPEPDTIDLEPRRTPSGRPVPMPAEALAASLYVPESAPPPPMPEGERSPARPRSLRSSRPAVDYRVVAVLLFVASLAAVALARWLD